MSSRVGGRPPVSLERPDLKHAAVTVAVVPDHAGAAAFLLTRRAEGLRSHRAQWALPGGRVDDGEDATGAALRELDEELSVTDVDVLGVLDDFPTRSGYRITPVVLWAAGRVVLRPNPDEVSAAYRIPLAELLRPDAPRLVDHPDLEQPVLQMPVYDRIIHAPTAAVLYQFREVALRGNDVAVAHFEQPPFAWR